MSSLVIFLQEYSAYLHEKKNVFKADSLIFWGACSWVFEYCMSSNSRLRTPSEQQRQKGSRRWRTDPWRWHKTLWAKMSSPHCWGWSWSALWLFLKTKEKTNITQVLHKGLVGIPKVWIWFHTEGYNYLNLQNMSMWREMRNVSITSNYEKSAQSLKKEGEAVVEEQ